MSQFSFIDNLVFNHSVTHHFIISYSGIKTETFESESGITAQNHLDQTVYAKD